MDPFTAIAAGLGIVSAADDLFGTSDAEKASQRQSADTRMRIDYAKEQADRGRQDVQKYMDIADQRLKDGLQSATDIQQAIPAAQIQPLREGSRKAQANILAGMHGFESAILGGPTGLNRNPFANGIGLRPVDVGSMPHMMRPFSPQFTEGLYGAPALAGAPQQNPPGAQYYAPGSPGHKQVVDQLDPIVPGTGRYGVVDPQYPNLGTKPW